MKEIRISKKPRERGDDGHKIISLRIRNETLEKIEDIANKTERSRNELINILLTAAIESTVVVE
jgi:hypothetical protein